MRRAFSVLFGKFKTGKGEIPELGIRRHFELGRLDGSLKDRVQALYGKFCKAFHLPLFRIKGLNCLAQNGAELGFGELYELPVKGG